VQLATFRHLTNFVYFMKNIQRRKLTLQHDSVRPNIACLTFYTIQKNGWELLFCPPYSPDLAPSDNHLFWPLKDRLTGHYYKTDMAVQEAKRSWLWGAGMDFYCRGIFKILQHWQKCIDWNGDFVEK
jgi:histone-lysine N-methyltransferase SETMAR